MLNFIKPVICCLVIGFVSAEYNTSSVAESKSEARSQQSSPSLGSSSNLVSSYQTVVRPAQSRDGAAHGAAHGGAHGAVVSGSYGAPAETSYSSGGYDYHPQKGQTYHYNLYPSDHSSGGYEGGSSYGSSSGYGEDEHGGGGGNNKKGKKGLLGLLGLLGLGGLGGLPLLLLAIPLLLLALPLLALIPIPAITITGGRKRRELPGMPGFYDMTLKQRMEYQVNALTDLSYNVLRSEHCFERMACEVSTRAHGSRFDKLLQWFLTMVESTIPKTFQKAIRAYVDSGRMARDGGPVCNRFPCDPLQPFHDRFFPSFRRRQPETNEVRRMKTMST